MSIDKEEMPKLLETEEGLALVSNELKLIGDYSQLLPRIKKNRVSSERIVKAVKIKDNPNPTVWDATAGLGEDSFLLAAAGCNVVQLEYDNTIFALLSDAHKRALDNEELREIAMRMEVVCGDSILWMKKQKAAGNRADVIYLDPMFPEKTKNALTNKKLQLFQLLESPCSTEEELFAVARACEPKKIVVKRPVKGPYLANHKPNHSFMGKTVRFDCYL